LGDRIQLRTIVGNPLGSLERQPLANLETRQASGALNRETPGYTGGANSIG
jgi:hypothetical protein